MSSLHLDHPTQDLRIGLARAACARRVLAEWRECPDLSSDQAMDLLRDLLEHLGLLPGQNPDRMINITMSIRRGGEIKPRIANVGTSFNRNYN